MSLLVSDAEFKFLYDTAGKATIRSVKMGHIEIRVPADSIESVKRFYYEKAASTWKIDVLPLGHEEAYTIGVILLPDA